ncbi:MAG: radical SAM protein [Candidatus Pacearchaeota archaeon]|jgi:MoaA/NifB/PqqE/SkfB family radical SAM enzyme
MKKDYRELLEFQTSVLDSLGNGVDSKVLAKRTRDFLEDFYKSDSKVPQGSDFGLTVNRECNLRCKHCYYEDTHVSGEGQNYDLSAEDISGVVGQAVENGFSLVSVMGKEPLLSPEKTKVVLDTAKRYGAKSQLLTNGILLPENISWLEKCKPYFTSISFDGYGSDHDFVSRGEGNYERAKRGLEVAKENGIENLIASFVAMPHNINSLDKMLFDVVDSGADYASIGFYFPSSFEDKSLYINSKQFYEVLKKLENVPESLKTISVHLEGNLHPKLISRIYMEGFFKNKDIAVVSDFSPMLAVVLNDKPRTVVQTNILPIEYFGMMRMEGNGDVTDCLGEVSIGNVKEKGLMELYDLSKNMWAGHTERFFEKLRGAFQDAKKGEA